MGLARSQTKEQRYYQDTFSTVYPVTIGGRRLAPLSAQLPSSNGAIVQAAAQASIAGGDQSGGRRKMLMQIAPMANL
jgi:hypothetical protein